MSERVKECVRKAVEGELEAEGVHGALDDVLQGLASDAQVGALLAALKFHESKLDARVLLACASALLAHAHRFPAPAANSAPATVVDIVGTGGDGMDTFNVSTAASFLVAASSPSLHIAKHGNRSSSGSVGSADLLEALGARVDLALAPTAEVLAACRFAFVFARECHPAMARVAKARKEIGVRTVFNLLGPLANPADPNVQVTGVGSPGLGPLFAEAFRLRQQEGRLKVAVVVHSNDGLDEVSCADDTTLWLVRDNTIQQSTLNMGSFGLEAHPLDLVVGGSPHERAVLLRRILGGHCETRRERAVRDYVVANAALAVWAADQASDLKAAAAMVMEALTSGNALRLLNKYVGATHELAVKHRHPNDSILQHIKKQRIADVNVASSCEPLAELSKRLDHAPALLDFRQRLEAERPAVAVLAEMKRASPSKGAINMEADVAEVAHKYAGAGAAAMSVLTEPNWFKGTLEDMRVARLAVESKAGPHNRPAILRKDFVVHEYQVYEARVWGADTLLLIVAILSDEELKALLQCSRSLGMEPLVEAANEEEMARAIACGSTIVGINNRNLHNFSVDMGTTERVMQAAKGKDVFAIALSGISSRADVQRFMCAGVQGVLVGEALMRSKDAPGMVASLRGVSDATPLVKICGCRDAQVALHVARCGADFVGIVFAESPRQVTGAQGKDIVDAVRGLCGLGSAALKEMGLQGNALGPAQLREAAVRGPLVVGVFADQDVGTVNALAEESGIDIIQLSGEEDVSDLSVYCRPVVKALHVSNALSAQHFVDAIASLAPYPALLDTKDKRVRGGTGKAFDWNLAAEVAQQQPFFLAGGLSPDNIREAVSKVCPFAVDVSSGVETDKVKDLAKIEAFVHAAKLFEPDLIK